MTIDLTRFALVSIGGLVVLAALLAARRTLLARRHRDLKIRHRAALRALRDITTAVDEWADDDSQMVATTVHRVGLIVAPWRAFTGIPGDSKRVGR